MVIKAELLLCLLNALPLVFFDLCDDDDAGVITEDKLLKFLRKNLKSEEEKKILRVSSKPSDKQCRNLYLSCS
jgi:hypothetical protein